MSRTLRIAGGIAGFLGGLLFLLGMALLVLPWDWARGPLERRLSDAAGRGIAVDGPLRLHLGLIPRLEAEGLRIANAPWGNPADMVRIARLSVSLSLPDLLRGRVVVPDLELVRPVIVLQKNSRGEANWRFANPGAAAAKAAAVPKTRRQVPVIEHLAIDQGRLTYQDPTQGIDLSSRISTATGGDPAQRELRIDGEGELQKAPFHLAMEGGSILTLRQAAQPYPLRIEATVGQTRLHVEGSVTEPLNLAGIDLVLALEGEDLAEIFPIFGIPLPHSPAYSLRGHLLRQGGTWSFRDFAGHVGGSDLNGTAIVTVGGPRPRLEATLTSTTLALADLSGFVGGRPGTGETPTKSPDRVLPATPVNLGKLRAMDMDVHFLGRRIDAGPLPVDTMEVALALDGGRASLDPLSFGVAGGHIAGKVVLDGRAAVPRVDLDLSVRQLLMSRIVKDPQLAEKMSGILGGHIQLNGQGPSTADMLADADGRISLFMGEGSVSHLLIALMGIDLARALGVLASGDQPVPVRCLVADMPLRQGVLQAETLVFDTSLSTITGSGRIDLRDESLDLRLLAHPKQPSLLSARAPIDVGGDFKSPSFGLDPKAEAARGTAATVLGALLTPLGALLPFIDLGLGKDSPCARLIQEARNGK